MLKTTMLWPSTKASLRWPGCSSQGEPTSMQRDTSRPFTCVLSREHICVGRSQDRWSREVASDQRTCEQVVEPGLFIQGVECDVPAGIAAERERRCRSPQGCEANLI